MTHQDKKLMCTSLDCPERTGGECNFEIPLLEELLAEARTKTKCGSPTSCPPPTRRMCSGHLDREWFEDTYKRIKEEGRREGVRNIILYMAEDFSNYVEIFGYGHELRGWEVINKTIEKSNKRLEKSINSIKSKK